MEETNKEIDPNTQKIQIRCDTCHNNRLEILYILQGELHLHCLGCGALQEHRAVIGGELI